MTSEVEYEFETELRAYCEMWRENGIHADNIERGIDEYDGAIATARWYVMNDTEGLGVAVGRLGCQFTIEWLGAESRFSSLFDDEAITRAREKLTAAGC